MSTLAVLVTNDVHYAAATARNGSATLIPDPETGRPARSNDVALLENGAWFGGSALAAALAQLVSMPYTFAARDLRNFASAVAVEGDVSLSAEGSLALLVRNVALDARSHDTIFDRVIIALDIEPDDIDAASLQCFLSNVLDMSVFVRSMDWTLRRFLSDVESSTQSRALLAVLGDRVLLGRYHGGQTRIARMPDHPGLSALRHDIECEYPGAAPVNAWSQRRVWREFVRWFEQGESSDASTGAFCAHLIDHRFRRRRISRETAAASIRKICMTMSSCFAMADEMPTGSDLYLVGDDALNLGLREAAAIFNVSSQRRMDVAPLYKFALAMTTWEIEREAVSTAHATYGLLVRERPGMAKELRPVVLEGEALPVIRESTFRSTPGQLRFKFDVALQRDGESPQLIRQLWFEPKRAQQGGNDICMRFSVMGAQRLNIEACAIVSRESFPLVQSRMPALDGSWLSGPETLARLRLADA